ncbi:MAG: type III-B CRISPR module-associated protein Cmr5 [Bacteroidales bacterium]|nr:type III-B CRISPR module-associated protein Cmr5 [Bacteroidales bacterium]
MSVHTRSQKLAQAAFPRIQACDAEMGKDEFKEYVTITKKFPSLIHTCGLAQAVAFYEAKGKTKPGKPEKPHLRYLKDLAAVLTAVGHQQIGSVDQLADKVRREPLSGYLRLSRDAINAASWLKRYVEAVAPDEEDTTS